MSELANCARFQELLDRFAAGSHSERDGAEMKEHAAACEECALLLRMEEHYLAETVDDLSRGIRGLVEQISE